MDEILSHDNRTSTAKSSRAWRIFFGSRKVMELRRENGDLMG